MAASPSRKANRAKAKAKAKNKSKATSAKTTSITNLNNSLKGDKSQSARKSAAYYANNGPMLREKAKLRMRNIRAARATTAQLQTSTPASTLNQGTPHSPTPDSSPLPEDLTPSPPPDSPPRLHYFRSPTPDDLSPSESSPDYFERLRGSRSPTPDGPPRSRSPSPTRRSRRGDDRCIDPRLRSTHLELDDLALQGHDLDLEFDLSNPPHEFNIDNTDLEIQYDHVNLSHNLDVFDHFDTTDRFYLITHRRCVGEWASQWGHTSFWAQEFRSTYHRLRTEDEKEEFACLLCAHAYQGRILVHQLQGILDIQCLPKKQWQIRELWRHSMELLEPMYRGLAIIDAWMDFRRVVSP